MINGKVTIGKAEPGEAERGGLPSASGLARVAACPGSFKMEAKSGVVDTSSPAAERGTRIHAMMEGLEVELSPEERLVAKEMMDYDSVLLDCNDLIREVRMWYEWTDGERMFSGKIDVGGIDRATGNTVLVNYKTAKVKPRSRVTGKLWLNRSCFTGWLALKARTWCIHLTSQSHRTEK